MSRPMRSSASCSRTRPMSTSIFAMPKPRSNSANYEGAISALERLLLYNPNFPGVKLQLAELYTRLGSYTAARAYIDQVEKAPDVTAETRARVRALRAQIERASSPSQFAVNLVTGLRHQS